MASEGPRILVVAQAWAGDVVLSQMLYALLRREQPDTPIDVAAPPWAGALLRRMPEVDRHLVLEARHGQLKLRRRGALARRLCGRYGQAIVIPRSFKAALLPYWARIPQRTGFGPSTRLGLINDVRPRPPGIRERMAQLASSAPAAVESVPWPHLRTEAQALKEVRRQHGLDPDVPLVGLLPGAAYGPAKQWGTASFAELGALLAAEGRGICVLGTAQERSIGDAIAAAAPQHAVNLCGATTLDQAIDLIAGLDAVVSNDSGLLHVAAAVETPVVGIYGATSPDTHPPLIAERAVCSVRALCSPCGRRACPYGSHACMAGIVPAEVFDVLRALRRWPRRMDAPTSQPRVRSSVV